MTLPINRASSLVLFPIGWTLALTSPSVIDDDNDDNNDAKHGVIAAMRDETAADRHDLEAALKTAQSDKAKRAFLLKRIDTDNWVKYLFHPPCR